MNPQLEAFTLLLGLAAPAFTQPSYAIFRELISAWVLCPARHTVAALIRIADPGGRRAHDAYHRFLRAGVWSMAALWASIARHMVEVLCGNDEVLYLDVDDTLLHKSGRKVAGAANFRDPIRSRAGRLVYALGLNVVVLTLRIRPPWGGELKEGGQTLALLAGAAPLAGDPGRGRLVDRRVAAHPGDDLGPRQPDGSECGVGAVAGEYEAGLG